MKSAVICDGCGKTHHAVAVRRVRKRGRYQGKVKVFADRRHTLCRKCHNSFWQQTFQQQKFEEEEENE